LLFEHIKTAIDELRMQMIGAHFLFGLQLQGTFREGFARLSPTARIVDAIALSGIVLTLTVLIAGPAQHRLVEQGDATRRILSAVRRLADFSLLLLALTLGCDAFVVTEQYVGSAVAASAAATTVASAMAAWYGLGHWLRRRESKVSAVRLPASEQTALHDKVQMMLTEARVVLPGIEGIIGFQLVIPMSVAFAGIPAEARYMHFAALFMVALSSILLLSPAAVHRLAFHGSDSTRFLSIGSRLLTVALAPFAVGVAADFYVAAGRMLGYNRGAMLAAAAMFAIMMVSWYIVPWAIRRRHGAATRTGAGGHVKAAP
jgi:hypothetical protein